MIIRYFFPHRQEYPLMYQVTALCDVFEVACADIRERLRCGFRSSGMVTLDTSPHEQAAQCVKARKVQHGGGVHSRHNCISLREMWPSSVLLGCGKKGLRAESCN